MLHRSIYIVILAFTLTFVFLVEMFPCPPTNGQNGIHDVVKCKKQDSKIRHEDKPLGACATQCHMTCDSGNKYQCHRNTVNYIPQAYSSFRTPLKWEEIVLFGKYNKIDLNTRSLLEYLFCNFKYFNLLGFCQRGLADDASTNNHTIPCSYSRTYNNNLPPCFN